MSLKRHLVFKYIYHMHIDSMIFIYMAKYTAHGWKSTKTIDEFRMLRARNAKRL